MQFTTLINNAKSIEWGLTIPEAYLFSYLYEVPSWADDIQHEGKTWKWISRKKIMAEMPLLDLNERSVYRLMKSIESKGLVILGKSKSLSKTIMRLTDKGKEWRNPIATIVKNDDAPSSKMTMPIVKNDEQSVNHLSVNQESIKTPVPSDDGTRDSDAKKSKDYPDEFESLWQQYPKRSGSNPKRSAFKAWSARLKSGAHIDDIAEGVNRYRKFIIATGKLHTQFVMQAATFFGPDERYLEDWSAPALQTKQNGMAQPLSADDYTPVDENSIPDWLKD